MRTVDTTSLQPGSACSIVAHSSAVEPEFFVGGNEDKALLAARWRRRSVRLHEPVRLADHVLSYCASGSATCSLSVGAMRCDHVQQAGVVTFLPADQPVRWVLESPREIVHVHLYLSNSALTAFACERGSRSVPPQLHSFIAIRDDWLENYFRLLISEHELYGRCGRLADSLFLDETESLLFSRLLLVQAAAHDGVPAASMPARVSALRPAMIGRINEFVLQNLRQRLRLQQLANIAGLSIDHFIRAFHRATGLTPHRYVVELRLNHACGLLRDTSAPIAHIAHDCGFSCAAQFSVAFHRRYGLSPSQYRKRH